MSASLSIKARKAKPPRYPYSMEIQYARILTSIVEKIRLLAREEITIYGPEIKRQVDLVFMRGDAISTTYGWGKLLADLIERIALGITETLLAALNKVSDIALNTNAMHRQDFIRQTNQAYGRIPNTGNGRLIGRLPTLRGPNPLAVNILNNEPSLPALLSAWEQSNLALIKSIPDSVVGQLRAEFTQAFVNGTNLKDLTTIVEERTGVGKSRAKLIARDQIGKLNGQLSEMRHKAAGIDSYTWRTVGDERVRPKHRVRNGKTYSWSNTAEIKPGQEIRCLTGNSVVDFSNGCNRLWRRWYTGKLTSLFIENGLVFESTPNHPILTNRGWLLADELKLGDYIIYSVSDGVVVTKNNDSGRVSRIEDAFESFANAGTRGVSLISETDFHGDGIKGEIDVVNFDRFLTVDDISQILHSGGKFNFSLADNPSSAGRSLKQKLSSSGFSSGSNVSRQMQRETFGSGEVGPSNLHGIAGISGGNVGLFDDSINYEPFDPKLLSQTIDASTIDVERDDFAIRKRINSVMRNPAVFAGARINAPSAEQFAEIVRMAPQTGGYVFQGTPLPYKAFRVVEKKSRVFVGHVYNLETDTGWYIADGAVTHNCRCVAEPVFPDLD